jgi:cytochrome c553
MKKIYLILSVFVLLSLAAVMAVGPSLEASRGKAVPTNSSIPANVLVIFKNSCMTCHGEGGKGMAMSLVNFSDWDNYPAKKQAKKAKAICNNITSGAMPPASVRTANPDKVPTAAQTEIICNWANSLNTP